MTREEYEKKFGKPPPDGIFYGSSTKPTSNSKRDLVAEIEADRASRNPKKPKKDLLDSATDFATGLFPGKEIGKSLVQAGTNVANLATGGVKKFQQGLDEGNRVNVPALIGDYGQAALMTGGAAAPIARAKPLATMTRVPFGAGRAGVDVANLAKNSQNIAKAKNIGAGMGIGYAGDVAAGLKEGESVQDTLTPGLGTILGGVGGGLAGSLTKNAKQLGDIPDEIAGNVKTGMQARKSAKEEGRLLDLVMSEAGKKRSIQAFRSAGQEGGVSEVKGRFKVNPTKADRERMEAVRGIVDPSKSAVENNTRLNNEIIRISKEELEPFLRESPRAFNVQTINSRLKSLEMPDLFKTDKTLQNTYNLVRQRMLSSIESNPKTMEGLWKARKQFDQEVQEQFGDAVFNSEKNTAIKRAIRDMRNQVNDYIADEIGGTEFKDYMKKLSNIYVVRDNVAEKAWKQLGTTKFSRWWGGLSQAQRNLILYGGGAIAGSKILFGGAAAVAGE